MMDAAAFQLHCPAVDLQTVNCVGRDHADAEKRLRLITDALQSAVFLQAHAKDAHVFHLNFHLIQIGMLCIPGQGPLYRHGNPGHCGAAGLYQENGITLYYGRFAILFAAITQGGGNLSFCPIPILAGRSPVVCLTAVPAGSHLPSVQNQACPHPHLMVFGEMAAQGHFHHDIGALSPIRPLRFFAVSCRFYSFPCFRSCFGFIVNPLRIGKNPVRLHMQGLYMRQFHMAVDACARIPPGVGLHAGIHCHRHPVLPAEIQRIRDIHGKGSIAVMVPLHQTSVHGH